MLEREKQREKQQEQTAAKERRAHPQKQARDKHQPEQEQAGMATDPETMRDPDYIRRMNEKTSKH